MNRDDIISIAREAGIVTSGHPGYESSVYLSNLERFHDIAVAEKNKEIERLREAVSAEREACARMVDHILKEGGGTYGKAIRARGEV